GRRAGRRLCRFCCLRFRLFVLWLSSYCGWWGLWRSLQNANFRSWWLGRCRRWNRLLFRRRLHLRFRLSRFLRWFYDLHRLNVFNETRANLRKDFLREVFETNTFCNFVRHRVRRHTYVYALPTRILHYLLVVELELFGKIVNSNFVLTCRHN